MSAAQVAAQVKAWLVVVIDLALLALIAATLLRLYGVRLPVPSPSGRPLPIWPAPAGSQPASAPRDGSFLALRDGSRVAWRGEP